MRAALLEKQGSPIRIVDDMVIAAPRHGEVRIRVHYCSLCHSDYNIVSGVFPLQEPIVVGHEAAGIVESIGPGVTGLAPGDAVIVSATYPCGHCYFCQRGQFGICASGSKGISTQTLPDGTTPLSWRGQSVLRGLGAGALAEYMIAPAPAVVRIDSISHWMSCVSRVVQCGPAWARCSIAPRLKRGQQFLFLVVEGSVFPRHRALALRQRVLFCFPIQIRTVGTQRCVWELLM